MLWIKSFHIVFMVAWFAGLFYLPRLFVYHTEAEDTVSIERFKIMERKLYFGIMTPSMLITVALGTWLWLGWWSSAGGWMHTKLALVLVLIVHHFYLGKLMVDFKRDSNRHGHVFYRWLNEIPALPALIGIVYLVVAKPF
jgi:protoporphyrinogen IX oxidase